LDRLHRSRVIQEYIIVNLDFKKIAFNYYLDFLKADFNFNLDILKAFTIIA
jgi:hypothetical protein